MALVFVYGTLKGGCGNHRVIARHGGEFVDTATTGRAFGLRDCGFPYMVDPYRAIGPGVDARPVRGEVWRVSRACVADLDRLEGFRRHGDPSNHYDRVRVRVRFEFGGSSRVWAYVASSETTTRALAFPKCRADAFGRYEWVR